MPGKHDPHEEYRKLHTEEFGYRLLIRTILWIIAGAVAAGLMVWLAWT